MDFEEEFKNVYVQPTLPSRLDERYNVLSCLRHTPHKQIYLIEDNVSGKKYILKCAYGSYASLLKNEYSVLKMAGTVIDCPKIVGFTEEAEYSYIVREYIEGYTLYDVVERGELSTAEVFDIIKKVCSALQKLHSLDVPIIVRDIKPENIVLRDNECVFIDFDAAREWNEKGTTDTMCVGTRTTAAPEQFGYSQTDVRTDIYAIGKLMTYLLTGGYEISEIKDKRAKRIVEKCTRFSPDKRYKNVEAVCRAMSPSKLPYIIVPAAAIVAVGVIVAAVFGTANQNKYVMSPTNTFAFTKQAERPSDSMVSKALKAIDAQSGGAVRAGKSKREMIEYLLKDSQYAVFGGEDWPCRSMTDDNYFINIVGDAGLASIDGTTIVELDTKASASLSTGWYVSAVVYTPDVSFQSFRVYFDGNAGEYKKENVESFLRKHLQAGEQLRIDETRSMSFVSCDSNGFYFIEYGSDDNSDSHLRLRYYTFDEFTTYINSTNKQIWVYEIDPSING